MSIKGYSTLSDLQNWTLSLRRSTNTSFWWGLTSPCRLSNRQDNKLGLVCYNAPRDNQIALSIKCFFTQTSLLTIIQEQYIIYKRHGWCNNFRRKKMESATLIQRIPDDAVCVEAVCVEAVCVEYPKRTIFITAMIFKTSFLITFH